ncbi:MAG: hypothetical protein ACREQ3_25675, partial [Candidatus Binatia bacterium]
RRPEQQVKMDACSRNHLCRRRSQVMIDAGPRNHLHLLGEQVKIRSCPRNQDFQTPQKNCGVFAFNRCNLPTTQNSDKPARLSYQSMCLTKEENGEPRTLNAR